MFLPRSIYRRPCVDHDGLRNLIDPWLAGGGKFHRDVRRKISAPAGVLPCWRSGMEAEVDNPASLPMIRTRSHAGPFHRVVRALGEYIRQGLGLRASGTASLLTLHRESRHHESADSSAISIIVTPGQWECIEVMARERKVSANRLVVELAMEALDRREWR